jgi:hypothetical protein
MSKTKAPHTQAPALSPTTGESVEVTGGRDRLGVWMIIVSCTTGTIALLVSYAYLWSLNVNNAWAPTAGSANWAPVWPFWSIFTVMLIATLLMWNGYRGLRAGNAGALKLTAIIASLLLVGAFVAQVLQIATFPFGPADGAYASATLWLAIANGIWLFLAVFLTAAIFNRTRAGRVTPENPNHVRLVAMFLTYLCVAAFLGSVFTTVMQESPNSNSPSFGTFSQ